MVFAIALLWDWVAPRIQLKQQLRAAKLRASRVRAPRSVWPGRLARELAGGCRYLLERLLRGEPIPQVLDTASGSAAERLKAAMP